MFIVAVVGAGFLYYFLAQYYHEPAEGPVEAIYLALTATFLQPLGNFPHAPVLQLIHFITPLAGVGILAHGLADFGVLFFNRQARGKEWEMAVAIITRCSVRCRKPLTGCYLSLRARPGGVGRGSEATKQSAVSNRKKLDCFAPFPRSTRGQAVAYNDINLFYPRPA